MNGGLNLSVLDGWWSEAYRGTTAGGSRARRGRTPRLQDARDADALLRRCSSGRSCRSSTSRDAAGIPRSWDPAREGVARHDWPFFNTARALDDYVRRIDGGGK